MGRRQAACSMKGVRGELFPPVGYGAEPHKKYLYFVTVARVVRGWFSGIG